MFDIAGVVDHFPYLGILALLILGEIGFPFPEDATLLLTGVLTAHEVMRPLPAFLVLYAGLLITDFSLYWVGKKYGRSVVERKRFRNIISPDRLSKLEEKFRRWGGLVVFLGRHVWGLRAQIFLVAGVMKMSATKFVMADGIAALLTIALWGGIGYLGGNSLQVLKKDATRIEHIAVVVLVILLACVIFFWYLKNKWKFGQKGS
jgi:membrane protein DedA with SNARE-associated domain